jgi:hypothetical protein
MSAGSAAALVRVNKALRMRSEVPGSLWKRATSLGGVESLVEHVLIRAGQQHARRPVAPRPASRIRPSCRRFRRRSPADCGGRLTSALARRWKRPMKRQLPRQDLVACRPASSHR